MVNGSFGDRFVEEIYLHADHATPTFRMYDFGSRVRDLGTGFQVLP